MDVVGYLAERTIDCKKKNKEEKLKEKNNKKRLRNRELAEQRKKRKQSAVQSGARAREEVLKHNLRRGRTDGWRRRAYKQTRYYSATAVGRA